jgi:hypothetical protein
MGTVAIHAGWECVDETGVVFALTRPANERRMSMEFVCPSCGYPGLPFPPYQNFPPPPYGDLGSPPYDLRFGAASFQSCDCCGYEFGFDCDTSACGRARSFREYREEWIQNGAAWFSSSHPQPPGWNLAEQLAAAGLVLPQLE